jgi:diadenosine tetraphosphate (Ap4A) HIT family hydrolase
VLENELAYVRRDLYPVSPGHLLIIPRRHVSDWFDLDITEREAILVLAEEARALLANECSPDGFNIGVNVGEAAGQTVWHAHLHLIPRYSGDVPNPRGGVRALIPSKQQY